jgi:hypothetical protein
VRPARLADEAAGLLQEGLWQAAEARNEAVQAGQGEDAEHGAASGHDQPQLAAFFQGRLMRPNQDAQAGGIAEPGAGHVHHDRGMPMGDWFEQHQAELIRGGDIDLGRGRYHGQAADHLDWIADVRHECPPPAQDAMVPGTSLVCAGAGEQAAAEHRTGWLVNRDAMLLLVKATVQRAPPRRPAWRR